MTVACGVFGRISTQHRAIPSAGTLTVLPRWQTLGQRLVRPARDECGGFPRQFGTEQDVFERVEQQIYNAEREHRGDGCL